MVAVLIFCQLLGSTAKTAPLVSLQVTFTGVQPNKGPVRVALYHQASDFMVISKAKASQSLVVGGNTQLTYTFEGLPPGQYAISSFQDLNNNGKLDKNFLGIPSEPYGFSNNARPKFRAPTWDEAAFLLGDKPQSIAIALENW